jgi:hypothetical protein
MSDVRRRNRMSETAGGFTQSELLRSAEEELESHAGAAHAVRLALRRHTQCQRHAVSSAGKSPRRDPVSIRADSDRAAAGR